MTCEESIRTTGWSWMWDSGSPRDVPPLRDTRPTEVAIGCGNVRQADVEGAVASADS